MRADEAAADDTAAGHQGWVIINSLIDAIPDNVEVFEIGNVEPFVRSAPNVIDEYFLVDFFETFNLLQDVQPQGDKLFVTEQAIQVRKTKLQYQRANSKQSSVMRASYQ
jgi:hypothetical protein